MYSYIPEYDSSRWRPVCRDNFDLLVITLILYYSYKFLGADTGGGGCPSSTPCERPLAGSALVLMGFGEKSSKPQQEIGIPTSFRVITKHQPPTSYGPERIFIDHRAAIKLNLEL